MTKYCGNCREWRACAGQKDGGRCCLHSYDLWKTCPVATNCRGYRAKGTEPTNPKHCISCGHYEPHDRGEGCGDCGVFVEPVLGFSPTCTQFTAKESKATVACRECRHFKLADSVSGFGRCLAHDSFTEGQYEPLPRCPDFSQIPKPCAENTCSGCERYDPYAFGKGGGWRAACKDFIAKQPKPPQGTCLECVEYAGDDDGKSPPEWCTYKGRSIAIPHLTTCLDFTRKEGPKPSAATCGYCERFDPAEASRLPRHERRGRCRVTGHSVSGVLRKPPRCKHFATRNVKLGHDDCDTCDYYDREFVVPSCLMGLSRGKRGLDCAGFYRRTDMNESVRECGMTFERDTDPGPLCCRLDVLKPGDTFRVGNEGDVLWMLLEQSTTDEDKERCVARLVGGVRGSLFQGTSVRPVSCNVKWRPL